MNKLSTNKSFFKSLPYGEVGGAVIIAEKPSVARDIISLILIVIATHNSRCLLLGCTTNEKYGKRLIWLNVHSVIKFVI